MGEVERWRLEAAERVHEVTVQERLNRRELVWTVDGEEVARTLTDQSRVVLAAKGHGAVGLRLPTIFGAARRVMWWPRAGELGALVRVHAGTGGRDFRAAGGRALEREAWIRANPRAYTVRRTLAAAVRVGVPVVLTWLLATVLLPAVPLPQVRLPSLPWPDVPLPTLPGWQVPWWVRRAAGVAAYLLPVALAAVLARAELRRRRRTDDGHRDEAPPTP